MGQKWSGSGFVRIGFFAFMGLYGAFLAGCSGSSPPQVVTPPPPPPGNPIGPNLIQLSSDALTVSPGQHATEVEPHMVAFGNTLVAVFQVGRIPAGQGVGAGSTAIGWATSSDGGSTWKHGLLPGLTTGDGSGTGLYEAASDPSVAYDAMHGVWMVSSLPVSSGHTPAVLVSRSTDGGLTWQTPVAVDTSSSSSDKNWIVCDTWNTSPHYGNCYQEWDDPGSAGEIFMSTSTDGGLTWSSPMPTSNLATGIGGQPLVQPNGNVVVPIWVLSNPGNQIGAFLSTNGGASWGAPVAVNATLQTHAAAAGIRSGPLPSAAIDGAGTVWVVWQDCRFRANCASNDLVYSTSSDGVTWSGVTRVPIDDVSSTVDHFIPGIGIDPATLGASAHVGIHYYYYSQTNCSLSTCQLVVGFISSANGGTTWNAPVRIAGPSLMSWLPSSQNGLMVGDYIATAFTNGVPHGVFAVPAATSGSTFDEAMYTGKGLTVQAKGRQLSSAADKPLHRLSDPIERERPEKGVIPPMRRARRSAK